MHIAECAGCQNERDELIRLLRFNGVIGASHLLYCETPGCPNNAQNRSRRQRQVQFGVMSRRDDRREERNEIFREVIPSKIA